MRYTKEKSVACLDWYPLQKGVIAISCAKRITLDERIDLGPPIYPKSSLLVIWSFHDPINPQLLLEAPEDISCFQFNPENPNIIAGGCINGQVVLWDISEYEKSLRIDKKANSDTKLRKASDVPIIKWSCLSSTEFCHKGPITDLQWLEQSAEHSAHTETEGTEAPFKQFVTCGLDGCVMYWDSRTRITKDAKILTSGSDTLGKAFLKVCAILEILIIVHMTDSALCY